MSKRILIVDDEEDIITFLETLFRKNGYETSTANNGITLDLQMPQNTGTDFYRQVRKESEFKEIPIIVVSGLPGRHLALPKPAAVFDKPIDPHELLKAVEKAIGD